MLPSFRLNASFAAHTGSGSFPRLLFDQAQNFVLKRFLALSAETDGHKVGGGADAP